MRLKKTVRLVTMVTKNYKIIVNDKTNLTFSYNKFCIDVS